MLKPVTLATSQAYCEFKGYRMEIVGRRTMLDSMCIVKGAVLMKKVVSKNFIKASGLIC